MKVGDGERGISDERKDLIKERMRQVRSGQLYEMRR
jgi:hypothetical protein